MTKLLVTALCLPLALLGALRLSAAAPQEANELARWIDGRIEAWQPTAEERRFDEIGWAADIREALRLAREHRRPVFLFTHDGRMAVGRC